MKNKGALILLQPTGSDIVRAHPSLTDDKNGDYIMVTGETLNSRFGSSFIFKVTIHQIQNP